MQSTSTEIEVFLRWQPTNNLTTWLISKGWSNDFQIFSFFFFKQLHFDTVRKKFLNFRLFQRFKKLGQDPFIIQVDLKWVNFTKNNFNKIFDSQIYSFQMSLIQIYIYCIYTYGIFGLMYKISFPLARFQSDMVFICVFCMCMFEFKLVKDPNFIQ